MKNYKSVFVAVALSAGFLAIGPAEAKPGMCPVPAKMPVCVKGSAPLCFLPVTCKSYSGKLWRVCLKWTCVRIPHPW